MAEVVYHHRHQERRSSSRSDYRAGATSPDSVIFTAESNFNSLFSSASASVERCSFASDAHDRDSLASEINSLHLAGHEGNELLHEASSGPDRDPDPNRRISTPHSNTKQAHAHSRLFKKVEKAKVQQEDDNNNSSNSRAIIELLVEDDTHLIDSARNSFSLALKECQERRSRSEAVSKKSDRRRPASLDLNNVIAAASSPRLSAVKKSAISSRKSGTFPSPGTPNYRHASVGMQKGWSSERVPLHNNSIRRQVNANMLLPFNNNGRTLPSKWEDAERWIFSPVSGDSGVRTSVQLPQRRPKSKSGPLGPPGFAYYSLYSPAMPVFDGAVMGNFMAGSPFSAGVIAADGLGARSNGNGSAFPGRTDPCMARSVSVHGCSEVVAESSLTSQDEKLHDLKDASADLSSVSRRDMATQMSPEGSGHSSPTMRQSFSASTHSALPIVEVQSIHSSKSAVRDVQVDERVTVTRWSKKHSSRNRGKSSGNVDDWRKKSADSRTSCWDVSEAAKSLSKAKREEAKIIAWENLQKAKAEAAIRKLEMKLEKKRSSSMDKIMNKLRSAQKRAQEMRSSVLPNQARQVSRTHHKAISFGRTRQMGSLSGCFTCHAF
ncbi:uncharacterized protein LOC126658747 [Mercurialis annua]|uniref:uncharacterized protein LOC126658747 n=1 Tax=Mercurialis annua TaxID=3986 RepID=UPI00216102DF|nr:uncharacterized protein LOC126658747 [Mercurialis annua]XP_050208644.1 uncharacterized protein LOC126658747 [Mercurialis annua]